MPKIEDVLGSGQLPPLQEKVRQYLEGHQDEVFSYRSEDIKELAKKMGHPNASAVSWSVWGLWRKGVIAREKVGRRYYYGSPKAIAKLRARSAKG